jgi:hypothetical protein
MRDSLVGFGDADRAAVAFRALDVGTVRIEVLRQIVASREVSTADLMGELGFTRNGLTPHPRALASAGLIAERHATHPRGSGPITYWRANVDSVLTTLDAVVAHVTDLIDER